mgnify:CR=1 FL=1
MTLQIWISLGSLLVAFAGLVFGMQAMLRARHLDQRSAWNLLREEVQECTMRLSVLERQMEVFWRGVSFHASQALHSPHDPEVDHLIERFQSEQISYPELQRFRLLLRRITEDEAESSFRRKAAGEVLTLITVRFDIHRLASPPRHDPTHRQTDQLRGPGDAGKAPPVPGQSNL